MQCKSCQKKKRRNLKIEVQDIPQILVVAREQNHFWRKCFFMTISPRPRVSSRACHSLWIAAWYRDIDSQGQVTMESPVASPTVPHFQLLHRMKTGFTS